MSAASDEVPVPRGYEVIPTNDVPVARSYGIEADDTEHRAVGHASPAAAGGHVSNRTVHGAVVVIYYAIVIAVIAAIVVFAREPVTNALSSVAGTGETLWSAIGRIPPIAYGVCGGIVLMFGLSFWDRAN